MAVVKKIRGYEKCSLHVSKDELTLLSRCLVTVCGGTDQGFRIKPEEIPQVRGISKVLLDFRSERFAAFFWA